MRMPATPSNETPISLAALRGILSLVSTERKRPAIAPGAMILPHFLDLHLVRIEGQMAGNLRHRGEGRLVGPDRVVERLAVRPDAIVARIPLVGAVGGAVGALQQRHVCIL